MSKLSLLTLSAVVVAIASTGGATARHHHHHGSWARIAKPVPPQQSLTMVGTPDCHVQGRFFRVTHHCPPEAVAASPR
jgi:hypothetical protein